MAISDVAARDAGADKVPIAAPAGFGEFTADLAAAAKFAGRGESAAIAAIAPFIGTSDVAVQAVGIDAIGHRLVLAINVAADDVAQETAQHHAADHRAAIAAAGRAADQSTRQGAEDGAGGGVAAAATLFIAAPLLIGRRGRRGGLAP